MPLKPEDQARINIDKLLTDGGWVVQERDPVNITARAGEAFRELEQQLPGTPTELTISQVPQVVITLLVADENEVLHLMTKGRQRFCVRIK